MPFSRRIRLYLIGVGLGVLASFMFFGKGCTNMEWTPGPRVKKRFKTTLIFARPHAQQQLQALGLTLDQVRGSLDAMDVDFTDSRRMPDSMYYVLKGPINGKDITFVVATLRDFRKDSTATLWEVSPHP